MSTDPTTSALAAVSSSSNSDAKSAIDFLTLTRGLKTTKRTGWIRQQAHPTKIESVADHSWRISLMSLIAASTTSTSTTSTSTTTSTGTSSSSSSSSEPKMSNTVIDTNRCLKMALVHDLAEVQVGDITPHCGISDEDKHQQECDAMVQMTNHLTTTTTSSSSSSLGLAGQEILELWKEYEEGKTMEAKLVKDMDKLEMILQALEYEQDGLNEQSLDGFFDSTRNKWKTEIGEAWGREIESRRRPNNKNVTSTNENKNNTNDGM